MPGPRVDHGVHPAGEGLEQGARLRIEAVQLGSSREMEPDRPGRPVRRQPGRPDQSGQGPEPEAAPEVHLEQAVLGLGNAVGREEGPVVRGADVGQPPLVPADLRLAEGPQSGRCGSCDSSLDLALPPPVEGGPVDRIGRAHVADPIASSETTQPVREPARRQWPSDLKRASASVSRVTPRPGPGSGRISPFETSNRSSITSWTWYVEPQASL